MWRKFLKIFSFINQRKIESINHYHIHPTSKLYNRENILVQNDSLIAEFVIIRAPISTVEIGSNTHIGPFTVILSGEYGVRIKKNVMIGPHCVIAAGNHEYRNLELPMINAGSFSRGLIEIDEDVWIGANCTITDNVKIGKGSIIGANSLVNKNVDPYSIVGGVPAKFISSRLDIKEI